MAFHMQAGLGLIHKTELNKGKGIAQTVTKHRAK